MRALVTGGTGFIGKSLVRELLNRGNEVSVLSRSDHLSRFNSPILKNIKCNLLTASPEELTSAMKNIDVIFHCAGQIKDESTMSALHIDATKRLALAASGKVRKWVHLSSVGVYGNLASGDITENTKLAPVGLYEESKLKSDELVFDAGERGYFEYSILRPSNVYGLEMSNQALYQVMSAVSKGIFFYIGPSGASANYIHVDNVVKALLLCESSLESNGQIFNLSDHCTLEDLIGYIANELCVEVPRLRLPAGLVRLIFESLEPLLQLPLTKNRIDALTTRAIYKNNKIIAKLGYSPQISIEKGIRDLAQYWNTLS